MYIDYNCDINSYEDYLYERKPVEYQKIFKLCYPDLNKNYQEYNSRISSFSRSTHRLVEKKGLCEALALAWHWVGKNGASDWARWQGGDKEITKKTSEGRTYKNTTPTYKMLTLTEEGFYITEDLRKG